ncbi:MAG TPA: 3-hydroxyacyl-CoA dehydrogenase [Rhodocyclaceae bacterium]|nr:3-hydroxyacyl-CoA dehydrogenase [Rhodocyclaceae bacterium]
MNINTLGLVGTGAMGRGIAQIAAQAGIDVLLFDTKEGAAQQARDAIGETLAKLAEKGKLNTEQVDAAVSHLKVVSNLSDLAPAQAVVEAIVEKLEIKQQLFVSLEDIVAENCILATNTSSLSVTAIAAACRLPTRVAGFHFFNPVPLMKIVEVIDGLLTDAKVSDALLELGRRMGHSAVRAKDTPGFIVNHAGRGLVTEGLRLLGEQVAEYYEIDRIMRDVADFRMGPCELLDLTALDVSQPVMESIYHQYYQEPRFRPSNLAQQRLVGGLLGRKSGRGFYLYEGGKMSGPTEALKEYPAPTLNPDTLPPLWISQAHPEFGHAVHQLLSNLGGHIETGLRPSNQALCIITPRGTDATTCASNEGLDARRTIAIDVVFGLEAGKRRTLMTTPITSPETRKVAHALFAADGSPVTVIHDSAGFVAQRIVAHIVNIGCDIAQQGVATPEDIDRAVMLGLGYPKGPLAFGDAIGPKRVLDILDCLYDVYRDPRYRASPWLRRRALLGVSLLTPEG